MGIGVWDPRATARASYERQPVLGACRRREGVAPKRDGGHRAGRRLAWFQAELANGKVERPPRAAALRCEPAELGRVGHADEHEEHRLPTLAIDGERSGGHSDLVHAERPCHHPRGLGDELAATPGKCGRPHVRAAREARWERHPRSASGSSGLVRFDLDRRPPVPHADEMLIVLAYANQ